jgi:hypothetical protein
MNNPNANCRPKGRQFVLDPGGRHLVFNLYADNEVKFGNIND